MNKNNSQVKMIRFEAISNFLFDGFLFEDGTVGEIACFRASTVRRLLAKGKIVILDQPQTVTPKHNYRADIAKSLNRAKSARMALERLLDEARRKNAVGRTVKNLRSIIRDADWGLNVNKHCGAIETCRICTFQIWLWHPLP